MEKSAQRVGRQTPREREEGRRRLKKKKAEIQAGNMRRGMLKMSDLHHLSAKSAERGKRAEMVVVPTKRTNERTSV